MKRIFNLLKNLKPNQITLINIIIIIVVFTGVSKYNSKKYPIKSEQSINGIKYTASINRHNYKRDSVLFLTFTIKNSSKTKKELEIKREILFNVEVFKEEKLVFKRDYIDKLSSERRKIRIGGYGKIVTGYEWNLIPNGEIESIENGKYIMRIYSKDLKIDMKIPFEISEEGL